MKKHLLVSLAALSLSFSAFAQGGPEPLRTSAGQLSPVQVLNCGSESVNIVVEVQGEEANISVNDIQRVYECVGKITLSGAGLNCTTTASDAPKTFELNTGSSGNGTFSFSGTPGSAALHCSI